MFLFVTFCEICGAKSDDVNRCHICGKVFCPSCKGHKYARTCGGYSSGLYYETKKGDISWDRIQREGIVYTSGCGKHFCKNCTDYKAGIAEITLKNEKFFFANSAGIFCKECSSAKAEREAREQAEREARWARERAEREAKEAREQAEREAKEAREQAEREAKEAREQAEREAREQARNDRLEQFKNQGIVDDEATVIVELERLVGSAIPKVDPKVIEWGTFGYVATGGHVTGLGLQNKGLSSLPDSMGNLTALETLDLHWNELSSLPTSIGNLENLGVLNLNNNRFSSLPDSIWQLKSLMKLDIGENQFTSLPGTTRVLVNMKELRLRGNKLTSLPEVIMKMTRLKVLDLANNQLSSLPDSIGNLTLLQKLVIESNQLKSLPKTMGNLTSLQDLDLSSNKLKELPDSMGNLVDLTNLKIRDNKLDEEKVKKKLDKLKKEITGKNLQQEPACCPVCGSTSKGWSVNKRNPSAPNIRICMQCKYDYTNRRPQEVDDNPKDNPTKEKINIVQSEKQEKTRPKKDKLCPVCKARIGADLEECPYCHKRLN